MPRPPGRTPASTAACAGTDVLTGLDRCAAEGFGLLRGARVALCSHPGGVLSGDLTHGVDAMVAAGVHLVALLGPEHGFRGSAQAGFAEADSRDPRTGVPMVDTYGLDPAALADALAAHEVDLVVIDLPDAGVRFHTYIWTIYRLAVARWCPRPAHLGTPGPVACRTGRRAGPTHPGLRR
ncbi:exo-beta-N-acetylmuramidase NamZ domain-containing protein [Aestuariimicrobium ganziense]|uniref:exo-beta-N-acetylmuramidase NamZ domain-containing protein n=1 Tax=Aestuariimicrobium ganziense TaxID=2773677 RepID=UPI002E2C53B4|nr:exo-beta-N-acetylmuramidase NamZ domain-containing protein [Aestuariimicrobium ganziense]